MILKGLPTFCGGDAGLSLDTGGPWAAQAEKHPTYRQILGLMWTTGVRISEMLALAPASFIADSYGYGVVLRTLKQGLGRWKKRTLQRSVKRYVPIAGLLLQDRIESYLYAGRFKRPKGSFRWRARP